MEGSRKDGGLGRGNRQKRWRTPEERAHIPFWNEEQKEGERKNGLSLRLGLTKKRWRAPELVQNPGVGEGNNEGERRN